MTLINDILSGNYPTDVIEWCIIIGILGCVFGIGCICGGPAKKFILPIFLAGRWNKQQLAKDSVTLVEKKLEQEADDFLKNSTEKVKQEVKEEVKETLGRMKKRIKKEKE